MCIICINSSVQVCYNEVMKEVVKKVFKVLLFTGSAVLLFCIGHVVIMTLALMEL